MSNLCNVQIHINGQETFFLNEKILCTYSEKLRKIVKQEKKRAENKKKMITSIEIDGFPGGPLGFETVSRFFHNNNGDQTTIIISPSNVALLYSCAIFLGMSENNNNNNLLQKTQTFLEGMFYWPWKDLLSCLKSCEPFLSHADSNGLLDKLFFALSAKMNSDSTRVAATSPSSSSSPETDQKATPESVKPSSCNKVWWFDDLTVLPPKIVERLVNHLELYADSNINGLTVTKFLLHYLKQANTRRRANNNSRNYSSKVGVSLKTPNNYSRAEFVALADVAVRGVISAKKESFSCRSLFWVLRVVVSGFGVRRELRLGLERLIGEALDQSKLDDLLVSSGQTNNGQRCGVYDVNLVIRLVRVFVCTGGVSVQKLRRVGRLVDEYLCEISPDQSLKTTTFLEVAESVPDLARDCFDGVYRAIDIYLQSHPTLSSDERSTLCRCLSYKKLTLEACKELAKNPKIPPRIAMQALISQQSKVPTKQFYFGDDDQHQHMGPKMAVRGGFDHSDQSYVDQTEDVKMNLKRMQRRVVELEKVCREMKGQMSRIMGINHKHNALPRLC